MQNSISNGERRQKRRIRRLQVVVIYAAIAICLAWFFESQSTTTLIIVRHAEKTETPVDDPSLSIAGQARAKELSRQLATADVVGGIDAVYSTPLKRALETARPIADALNIPINTYNASDTENTLSDIVEEHTGEVVLVVGHSDTLPKLIANLGASKNVPAIADDEYDNIYIVTIPWFGKTKTIRLRYGQPYIPK